MNDEMRKYWEKELLKIALSDPVLKYESRKLTLKEKLHNKYINAVNAIYKKLTGIDPDEWE